MTSGIWYLQLFGGLRAVRGDEVVDRFRSQKFGALLAYLALFSDRAHSREELADLFWPDADPETGRTNLRAGLSSLRRQFEPPGTPEGTVLQTSGRSLIRLGEGITTDVARFTASLTAARRAGTTSGKAQHLAQATQVYGGPLLPGHYESWALNERERLQQAYLDALRSLAEYSEQNGDLGQALDWARRALSVDPFSEEAHAGVIRLLMSAGQEAAARRQYDQLSRLLDERLGDTPSPATRALLSGHLSGTVSASRLLPRTGAAGHQAARMATLSSPPVAPESIRESPLSIPRLPAPVTRFFGREDEIAALGDWLSIPEANESIARLITVTGPGGSGKTRLVLEAARLYADQFPGGVFWVGLADISRPEELPIAVAEAMGLTSRSAPAPTAETAREQVIEALRRMSGAALLVLDNFEHLLPAENGESSVGADELKLLLSHSSRLICLVTSRARLLLSGEREFPLSPLPTPAHPGTPTRLMEFASVQLFVNRAQVARSDFQLSARNAATIAALCARLEGIPLAVELAAGWAETLTPAQMLQRLEHRFDLLVARRRDIPPRHRTLRAAIEGSFQVLSPERKAFFACLSVFRGGWSLAAAEAVTEDPDAIIHLTELKEHSLVTVTPADEEDDETGYRFGLLETLREFAAEQLVETGCGDAARRHALYYTALAEQAESEIRGPNQVIWLQRLEREHPNLRAALSWAASETDGDPILALRLVSAIWRFWMLRGHLSEGRQQIDRALAVSTSRLPEEAAKSAEFVGLRAAALHGAGCLARLQGDTAAARPLLEEALALFRRENDPRNIAMCLQNISIVAQDSGDYATARAGYEEALALRRAVDDWEGAANVLNSLGVLAWDLGDIKASRGYHEESVSLRRDRGQQLRAPQLLNLASVAQREGDFAAARSWYEEGNQLARTAGNLQALATGLSGLALLDVAEGHLAEARLLFSESLRLFLELGDQGSLAQTLEGCGALLIQSGKRGDRTAAARLWGAAETLRIRTGIPLSPNEQAAHEEAVKAARTSLGDGPFRAAWSVGSALSPAQAVAEAQTSLSDDG
jgi:predicted ATPase/DNA-binding SARP family transcriptional activator